MPGRAAGGLRRTVWAARANPTRNSEAASRRSVFDRVPLLSDLKLCLLRSCQAPRAAPTLPLLGLGLWNLRVRLWNEAGGAGVRSPKVLRKLDHLKGVPTCHIARSHRVTLDHPCVPTVSETRGTRARCHFSI